MILVIIRKYATIDEAIAKTPLVIPATYNAIIPIAITMRTTRSAVLILFSMMQIDWFKIKLRINLLKNNTLWRICKKSRRNAILPARTVKKLQFRFII